MNAGRFALIGGAATAISLPFWEMVPIVSYLLEIFLAIALILVAIQEGWRLMGPALVCGLFLGSLPAIAPWPIVVYLPLWLRVVIPPLVLGVMISHGWQAGRSFAAASFLITVFILLLYIQVGPAMSRQISTAGESLAGLMSATLSAQGYDQDMIREFVDSLGRLALWIRTLLPGIMILSAVGQVFMALLAVEWYHTRRDTYFPGFGPFTYWKMPEKALYLLGFALAVALTVKGVGRETAYNVIFVLAIFYAVAGLALVEHVLRRLRLPFLIKIVFYLGLFLMQMPGMVMTSMVGLIDSHFDFRRIRAHTLG